VSVTTVTGRAASEGVFEHTFSLPNGPFHFISIRKNVHSIAIKQMTLAPTIQPS